MKCITSVCGRAWPGFLPPRPGAAELGAAYDTDWARRLPARLIRRALTQVVSRPLIRALARPTVLNIDRIADLDGPVIFAANHASHLDISVVLTSLPSRFRHRAVVAAGADYWFDQHLKAAVAATWINVIPIEREKVGRRSADLTARLIDEGWNLVIFPEGGRSSDDFVAPFRGGAAYLSIRCGVPVVPIHIEGTRSILGKGARKLSPGPTRVTIGEPIRPMEGERSRELNTRIEQGVAMAADEGRTDWWSARRRSAEGTTPSLGAPDGVTGWRKAWFGSQKEERTAPCTWPK